MMISTLIVTKRSRRRIFLFHNKLKFCSYISDIKCFFILATIRAENNYCVEAMARIFVAPQDSNSSTNTRNNDFFQIFETPL